MKAKCRAMLYGVSMGILFSPFPICVIAPDFQPTLNIQTDKAQSAFDLGKADFTSNSPADQEAPFLQLFDNRGDLSTSNKNLQISSNNVRQDQISADLNPHQFGPYHGNPKKRLFDLALWPGESPVQKTPKQNKQNHSDKDWLQDAELSSKGKY
ncbi:hypothetical protein O181_012732 [Austropuccinia psidii MF-1]|uniref:Uncharacterized protein n=1 Tax=Austropuccinia psidii MF-1 TaxID=1389203 RepID=A0A9Q3BWY9_9BASI|nr:hypothetical protein [Austropuccinia psidii MF-1]